jgi:putative ABC transport system ATP-binding protein
MLHVKNIRKEFTTGNTTVTAVNDVSLDIEKGTFASIVGQSGSGKSTLMSLLGALDKPTSGKIEVEGRDITKLSDHELISYRAHEIGFIFQSYNLIPNLTAIENVTMVMEVGDVKPQLRRGRAQKLLDEVGLTGAKQKRKPSRLSGGEQQRVAIARALANNPKLLLADEPTGNLDSKTGAVIIELLKDLTKTQQTTVIVVTHDQALAQQTDKIFQLQDGNITEIK